jgi:serine/threonine protein kinase
MDRMAGRSLRHMLDESTGGGAIGSTSASSSNGGAAAGGIPHELLSWPIQTRWLMEVAIAMQHLGNCGVVHRDLRAANVLLDSANPAAAHAFVSDFGLAKACDSLQKNMHTYTHGADEWSAPETSAGSPSAATDCYSFGVLMYEVLSRKMPFHGLSPTEREKIRREQDKYGRFEFNVELQTRFNVTEANQKEVWLQQRTDTLQQRRPDVSVHSIDPDWPEMLLALMQQCWADDPEERPALSLLVTMLASCLEDEVGFGSLF